EDRAGLAGPGGERGGGRHVQRPGRGGAVAGRIAGPGAASRPADPDRAGPVRIDVVGGARRLGTGRSPPRADRQTARRVRLVGAPRPRPATAVAATPAPPPTGGGGRHHQALDPWRQAGNRRTQVARKYQLSWWPAQSSYRNSTASPSSRLR